MKNQENLLVNTKLNFPKIIGDEIIKPRIAFLESVKNKANK